MFSYCQRTFSHISCHSLPKRSNKYWIHSTTHLTLWTGQTINAVANRSKEICQWKDHKHAEQIWTSKSHPNSVRWGENGSPALFLNWSTQWQLINLKITRDRLGSWSRHSMCTGISFQLCCLCACVLPCAVFYSVSIFSALNAYQVFPWIERMCPNWLLFKTALHGTYIQTIRRSIFKAKKGHIYNWWL